MTEILDDQGFLRRVGQHAVGLVWEDSAPGEERASAGVVFSAFIMSVRGLWFLVSAGHIIDDVIHARLKAGRVFRFGKILDFWSEGRIDNHAITFPNLIDTPQGHINDTVRGIDYSWFYLRPFYREQLAANGIIPLSEGAWRDVPGDLESFNAFGFPENAVRMDHDAQGRYTGLRAKAVLMPYKKIDNPPAKIVLPFARMYFHPPRDSAGELESVSGMSGGPIFGYKRIEGGLRFWLVAVQSAQADVSRIAIGCPAEIFGRSFEHAIAQEIERRGLTDK